MSKDRIISVLGVPFNGDGTTPAEENPAAAPRLAGIIEFQLPFNVKVEDLGDIEIPAFSGIRDPDTSVLILNEWVGVSRRTAEQMISMFGKAPLINPHDIVVCGYREPDMIEDSEIRHFSAEKLKQIDPGLLAQQKQRYHTPKILKVCNYYHHRQILASTSPSVLSWP